MDPYVEIGELMCLFGVEVVLGSNNDWTVNNIGPRKDNGRRVGSAAHGVGCVGDWRLGKVIAEDLLPVEIHNDPTLIGNVKIDGRDICHSHKCVA